MIDIIKSAIEKGAALYASVSGGKDGQAMVKTLINNGFDIAGLVHADLGAIEWAESFTQCELLSTWYNIPLYRVTRSDGRGLLEHWRARKDQLLSRGKRAPFWSSSTNRYCTSDLKRGPINVFFTSTGRDFIISCEGIRADESKARAKKSPLSIRKTKTSSYYAGMSVEQAIENYDPRYRLTLDWYPIYNFSASDVWGTYNLSEADLVRARHYYKKNNMVPNWWKFHPAYVYGNDRVSCVFCVLGSNNDLAIGARHRPELLNELIMMEKESGYTFKNKQSLEYFAGS